MHVGKGAATVAPAIMAKSSPDELGERALTRTSVLCGFMNGCSGRCAQAVPQGQQFSVPPGRQCRGLVLIAALIAALSAVPAAAQDGRSPVSFDASLAVGTIDNLSQAEFSRDIVEDEFAELTLGVGYEVAAFDRRVQAVGRAFFEAREISDVSGLGHWGGGAELNVEALLTRSTLPPFLLASLRAEGQEYDFRQRDSSIYPGSVEVGSNIGPRTVVTVGGEYRDRQARSDVFDLEEWSAFVSLSLDLGSAWQLDLRAAYVDGDVWSSIQAELPNGQPVDDIFDLIAASEVIQRDDAFNDAIDGLWFVYRLPAESQEYSLRVSRRFRERWSVGFEWQEIRVRGDRDNDYDNRILQLSVGFDL